MQVISGLAKGLNLEVVKGIDVRPTTARARKSLFDSLSQFEGLTILDLFAGAGSLGFEAASRGATNVTFVEKNKLHCTILKKNIANFSKISNHCEFRVLNWDVEEFISSKCEDFDFIFSDPPYNDSLEYFKKILNSQIFLDSQNSKSNLIWEVPAKESNSYDFLDVGLWQNLSVRNFGGIKFLIIKV